MPAAKRKTSKKRKSTKSTKRRTKEAPVEHELPGGFWRQIAAVLMIALAVFFVITWFGQGGTVTNTVHQAILNGLGYATYFIPPMLVYLAVKIFRAEDNRVAFPVYLASILMLLWITGIAANLGNGGIVGNWLNSLMLNVLSQGVVILIYLVLIFITGLFMFQISPVTLFKGTKNATKHHKEAVADDAEPTKKSRKPGQLEIKVNSGVGALDEPAAPVKKSRHGRSVPASEPIKPAEPTALTAATDPDWKMPTTSLLTKKQSPADAGNIQQNAFIIKNTFAEFGIDVEMEGANVGPRVTQYTLKAPGGINLAKIAARDKELAYKLSATDRKSVV